jgi:tetratricopeptide (TPR) repeat protein
VQADVDLAPRLPTSRGERLCVVALSITFVALLAADLASDFDVRKLGGAFVLAFWLPMLRLHMLGHALASRLVGWRLVEVGVGFGRELLRLRVRSVRVRVGCLPLAGYALVQPGSLRCARAKRALVFLGGSLANLALVAALLPVIELRVPERGDSLAFIVLQSLALAATLIALCALVPYRSGGNPSDGLALLECAFASADTLRARHASVFAREARRLLEDEQPAAARELIEAGLAQLPDEPRLLGMAAVVRAAEGSPREAYGALEALGPPDARAPALRAELIADAARAVLHGHDETLLPDAERAAERALELCPEDPEHALLLGRVLVERRRFSAAYSQLMSAYRRVHDVDQEAHCVAYLALACRALSRGPGASAFDTQASRFEAAASSQPVPPGLRRRVLESAPATHTDPQG